MNRAKLIGLLSALLLVAAAYAQTVAQEVPEYTLLPCSLQTSLSTRTARSGDIVKARLVKPARRNGAVLLPAGSILSGRVRSVTEPNARSCQHAELKVRFRRVDLPSGRVLFGEARVESLEGEIQVDSVGRLSRTGECPSFKLWRKIEECEKAAILDGRDPSKECDGVTVEFRVGVRSTSSERFVRKEWEHFELKQGTKLWLRVREDFVEVPY